MSISFEGNLSSEGLKIGIVAARFNDFITSKLYEGAQDCLLRHGSNENDIHTAWVPGAFEIPVVAQKLAKTGKYDAIVCIGAIIKGATAHFDFVAGECAKGISKISLDTGVPVIFGVLTTDTIEQAIERSGCKAGNKGWECALAAIETAQVLRKIEL